MLHCLDCNFNKLHKLDYIYQSKMCKEKNVKLYFCFLYLGKKRAYKYKV